MSNYDYGFDDLFDHEPEPTPRRTRGKQVKRKWKEIEALKERRRLRRELEEIDLLHDFDESSFDF